MVAVLHPQRKYDIFVAIISNFSIVVIIINK